MAELTGSADVREAETASGCCGPAKLEVCCEPSAKPDCCGEEAATKTAPSSCGCSS